MTIASFPPHDLETVAKKATEEQKLLLQKVYKLWEELDQLEFEGEHNADAAAAVAKSIYLLNKEWGLID